MSIITLLAFAASVHSALAAEADTMIYQASLVDEMGQEVAVDERRQESSRPREARRIGAQERAIRGILAQIEQRDAWTASSTRLARSR